MHGNKWDSLFVWAFSELWILLCENNLWSKETSNFDNLFEKLVCFVYFNIDIVVIVPCQHMLIES